MKYGIGKHPNSRKNLFQKGHKFFGDLTKPNYYQKGQPSNGYWRGRKHTEEYKNKMSEACKGRILTEEHRRRISESKKGAKSHLWRGGITNQNLMARKGVEYKIWRKAVFERDDYTCQICFKRGGVLNADHLKSFSLYPELRWNLDNGRTLCFECHRKTPTFGWRSMWVNNLKSQDNKVLEYLNDGRS